MLSASQRDIHKTPFIIYLNTRSSTRNVLILSCNYYDCFSRQAFGTVHRKDTDLIDLILLNLLIGVLIYYFHRSNNFFGCLRINQFHCTLEF